MNSNGAILTAADYVAKWDGVSWSALGSNGAANGAIPTTLSSRVNTITLFGQDLLVGASSMSTTTAPPYPPPITWRPTATGEGPDTTPPIVESVTRLDATPSTAASVRFLVTFSEAVSGLGEQLPSNQQRHDRRKISQMNCTGVTCTFTATTGSGTGTIRLDVLDDDTIKDAANNPLGGPGEGNGDFTSGEVYNVRHYALFLPLVVK
ncbi:MAG: hypothetical protein R3D55_04390 [Chloroflexota bacterium]